MKNLQDWYKEEADRLAELAAEARKIEAGIIEREKKAALKLETDLKVQIAAHFASFGVRLTFDMIAIDRETEDQAEVTICPHPKQWEDFGDLYCPKMIGTVYFCHTLLEPKMAILTGTYGWAVYCNKKRLHGGPLMEKVALFMLLEAVAEADWEVEAELINADRLA